MRPPCSSTMAQIHNMEQSGKKPLGHFRKPVDRTVCALWPSPNSSHIVSDFDEKTREELAKNPPTSGHDGSVLSMAFCADASHVVLGGKKLVWN
jgi:hypothetical protein